MLHKHTRSVTVAIAGLAVVAGACAAGDTAMRSPGKPGAPAKIEATFANALSPGQPGELTLRIVPTAPVDRLVLALRGDTGIVVQSGQSQQFVAPAAGVALVHRASVMGAHEGHYRISAIVTTHSGGASLGRVLSIPVVVGNPAQSAKMKLKAAPPVDATGERIKSLPSTPRKP